MLLIVPNREPTSAPELNRGLAGGVDQFFDTQDGHRRVALDGQWPHLDQLSVDLSNLQTDPLRPPVGPIGPTQPSPNAQDLVSEHLRIIADPMRLAPNAKVRFEIDATGVGLNLLRDAREQLWLMPHHFASGRATIAMDGRDLEGIFLEAAKKAAEQHGVKIEDGSLTLEQSNPRELLIEAQLQARKLFVKSRILVRGRVAIDPQLHLHFSELTCDGKGLVGTVACQFLRPQLVKWESRPLPLLALAFPGVQLHDATLRTDAAGRLHASAEFGEVNG